MSIEAMKQALEALEELMPTGTATFHLRENAIIALRQAIQESTLQEISDIGQWDSSDMAHRSGGLTVEQSVKEATLQEIADIGQEIEREKMCVDCGKPTMHLGNKCYGCCQTTQTEQEPVAYLMDGELFTAAEYQAIAEQGDGAQPLYAVLPKREIEQAHTDHPTRHWDRTCPACVAEVEKQEPVAYVNNDGFIVEKDFDIAPGEKLYLAPPKREWVGLTDEEIEAVINEAGFGCVNIAYAIEAKLKEKNT